MPAILQEAFSISFIGIAAVFSSLTLLVLILFILRRIFHPDTTHTANHKLNEPTEDHFPLDQQTSTAEGLESSIKGNAEEDISTPEDKEFEEVAIIAAITATMGIGIREPEFIIETLIGQPQVIPLWGLLGRQQFMGTQGVPPKPWKR